MTPIETALLLYDLTKPEKDDWFYHLPAAGQAVWIERAERLLERYSIYEKRKVETEIKKGEENDAV